MALKTVLTGVAALSLISAPAFAADFVVPPPQVAPEVIVAPPPPVFTWTGGCAASAPLGQFEVIE